LTISEHHGLVTLLLQLWLKLVMIMMMIMMIMMMMTTMMIMKHKWAWNKRTHRRSDGSFHDATLNPNG